MIISNRIRQIIKGTILGGSSIIKPAKGNTCYLSMRSKKSKWLDYKALELSQLASERPFTLEVTNRWHSKCDLIFNDFETMFYKNRRRNINIDALNDLKDIAYMIWFGDCGSYNDKYVSLNTNVWGEKGTIIIKKYLELACFDSEIKMDRKGFRLKLSEESSKIFIQIIEPQFPHCLLN